MDLSGYVNEKAKKKVSIKGTVGAVGTGDLEDVAPQGDSLCDLLREIGDQLIDRQRELS